jgi:hypothetical protein
MMTQKIKFSSWWAGANVEDFLPAPAKRKLPNWFKDFPNFHNNEKNLKVFKGRGTNATLKMCPPFLDAMMCGYVICLETDLAVINEDDQIEFIWGYEKDDFIQVHQEWQVPKEILTSEYHSQPYKFMSHWASETPSGYSILFTHPLNRIDLPFTTLTGIVDTDNYKLPVNFPFLLKKGFSGVIPSGTPIAQLIPIKREPWEKQLDQRPTDEMIKLESSFLKTLYRSYKNQYWNIKRYD